LLAEPKAAIRPAVRTSRAARQRADGSLEMRRDGAIVSLTLPAAARLTSSVHAALRDASSAIDLDEDIRAVVLRACGDSFCVGEEDGACAAGADGVAAIAALRVPVVAVLHGETLDCGLELALACDLRIAADGSRIGLTQVARGELPHHGGTQRLPRVVGRGRALNMLLLAETLTAREALAVGLVDQVVPRRGLARAASRLAATLAERAPIAQRLAKEALRAANDLPLLEGLRLEGDLYVLLQSTLDRDAGIASFRVRRKPQFTGR
jgi:enoyl-CoA hydratase/carnithine racemase